MRLPRSMNRREFLEKWLRGLKTCNTSDDKNTSFSERKKAVKLSADIAMASSKRAATHWSRALIADAAASGDDRTRLIIRHILGPQGSARTTWSDRQPLVLPRSKRMRSKNILRRSRSVRRIKKIKMCDGKMGREKRLVKRKMQVLKRIIPGGDAVMDECCLMEETLDYVVSLKAQIDVMRRLTCAAELLMDHIQ